MANDNIPRGFIPLNLTAKDVHYYRVSTATDIYVGSPVTLLANGYVSAATATGVTPVLGVAWGFAGTLKRGLATSDPFLDASDLTPPTPSSDTGDRWIGVIDNPNVEFLVQEDTGGTALALADVGAATDFIYRGATAIATNGNTDTGWANVELDASGVVTTTAAQCQILRLADLVNSDGTENAVGDYAKWIVRFFHHQKVAGLIAQPGIIV